MTDREARPSAPVKVSDAVLAVVAASGGALSAISLAATKGVNKHMGDLFLTFAELRKAIDAAEEALVEYGEEKLAEIEKPAAPAEQ